MKLTISGSELTSHLRPLRAIVRQSDEIDYDRIALAITEDEDKRYLRAAMIQPTYDIFLSLNLSGTEGEGIGSEPIDADAVPCQGDEMWVFPWSALAACNRSVGQLRATFVTKDSALNVGIGENSTLHIDGRHRKEGIEIPVCDEVSDDEATCSGVFTANTLQKALFTPLRVCKLGGKNSRPVEQAVHLSIENETLTVEALSVTAEFSYTDSMATTINKNHRNASPLHLSISRDAAQVLSDIAALTGKEMHWAYNSNQKSLIVWCEPYVVRISTEEVSECLCSDMRSEEAGVMIDARMLYHGVMNARNAGCKTLMLMCLTSGTCALTTPQKNVEMSFDSRLMAAFASPRTFCLPVGALLAVIGGTLCREVCLSFTATSDYVVLETDEGCVCRLSVV